MRLYYIDLILAARGEVAGGEAGPDGVLVTGSPMGDCLSARSREGERADRVSRHPS